MEQKTLDKLDDVDTLLTQAAKKLTECICMLKSIQQQIDTEFWPLDQWTITDQKP